MKNDYEIRGNVTALFLTRKDGTILETIVDTEDLEKLNSFPGSWHAHYSPLTKTFYVGANDYSTGRQRSIRLHRYLLDASQGLTVDHINRDTLDNRRSNLRLATYSQNKQNTSSKNPSSKSGVRGVTWNEGNQKWWARVRVKGTTHYVGLFDTIGEADAAVKKARAKYMPYSPEALEKELK